MSYEEVLKEHEHLLKMNELTKSTLELVEAIKKANIVLLDKKD